LGAKLYWGRWNHPGAAVIYASQSVSFCALEVLVNGSGLPAGLVVTEIEIPDSLSLAVLKISVGRAGRRAGNGVGLEVDDSCGREPRFGCSSWDR
jgi:RES domain-containing protein